MICIFWKCLNAALIQVWMTMFISLDEHFQKLQILATQGADMQICNNVCTFEGFFYIQAY